MLPRRHCRAGPELLPLYQPARRRFEAIFSGPKKPPPVPAPQPMPDLLDPAVLAARRRTLDAAMARTGRASTNLTDDYAGNKLGTP